MKNFLSVLLISILAVSATFAYSLDKILLKNFNTVMTLAKYENKDAIIVFSDPTCFYCKLLKSNTLTNKTVQQLLINNFIIGEIYPTDEKATFNGKTYSYRELFSGFGVRGTPTLVFFQSDEKPITFLPGYAPPSDFQMILRYIAEKEYLRKVSFKKFAQTPNTFIGTPTMLEISLKMAEYILAHDPMSIKIEKMPNKNSDRFMKYVVEGKNATSTANKMIKAGFYNVFVVR